MNDVQVWEETVTISTYETGKPEENPMFFEKRVYQGSSGKVYPYPFTEKIFDEKVQKEYQGVFLENQYIKLMVLPQFGGRIHYALDKTNGYEFIYHNNVIKPALVGLTGPWISGGIEFNWPQHHRPNTFLPVDYKLIENDDGSKSVLLGEIERMSGLKEMHEIILHPDKAYIEISVQIYNGTPLPQTFLWWANPAVPVNENYQSIFPQDVHFVADHGKRDISRFPVATGEYYEMDYSEGVDISWYKNIPVPSSYMALSSDYDFMGGYDHGREAGILHVADHHVSPGKKLWTWGNGDFGRAWERELTDDDGPYVELMTGVYTDNQPDFSWLQPYETKKFTQYFFPYHDLGAIKNATKDIAVGFENKDKKLNIGVYVTRPFSGLKITVGKNDAVIWEDTSDVAPDRVYKSQVNLGEEIPGDELSITVFKNDGTKLITFQPEIKKDEPFPEPAKPVAAPEEIPSNDKLYRAGLHLEQYRHATYEPDSYYLEALDRDPGDVDNNNAYGLLLMRRGAVAESIPYFQKAIERLTERNSNPYKSEPYYNLGLARLVLNELDEAYELFYKCTWNQQWKAVGFLYMAQIECLWKDYEKALEHIEKSLAENSKINRALNLKISLLRKKDQYGEALNLSEKALALDSFNYGALSEYGKINLKLDQKEAGKIAQEELFSYLNRDVDNYLRLSISYLDKGMFEDAIEILNSAVQHSHQSCYPMLYYYLAFACFKNGEEDEAQDYLTIAENKPVDYCFPNTLCSKKVLEFAIEQNPEGARAFYYLGNLLYDKKQYGKAIKNWEGSRDLGPDFPTVRRNLAIAYYNKKGMAEKAEEELEKAFELNKKDARVFFELDQLYKKENRSPVTRLDELNEYGNLVRQRDDLYLEKITLCNRLGNYKEAADLLANRHFHPWEGGEGKITGQYVLSHVQLGKDHLDKGNYQKAIEELKRAQTYPKNLGEGKLAGARENNIFYYLGLAYEGLKKQTKAKDYFRKAAAGNYKPSLSMYYYDKASDMIFYQGMALDKLDRPDEAKSHFHKLIDYGEKHLFDEVTIDYFAISLPDFLVFDENLNKRNRVNCHYLMGLGYLGLKQYKKAKENFEWVLKNDINQTKAKVYMNQLVGDFENEADFFI
jgi:tetratricopeptide (TPR) repeat protein